MTKKSMGLRPQLRYHLSGVEAVRGHEPSEVGGEESDGAEEEDSEVEGSIIGIDEVTSPPIRIAKDPTAPTAEEREAHNVTHLPYRSWCSTCVEAKGKEDGHCQKKEGEKSDKPTVGIDYKSFGQSAKEDDKATAIVIRDKSTRNTYAHICERKGAGDKWIVSKIVENIGELGYTEIILKGDGEPALNDVMEKVKSAREHSTILQNPPAYDPQSNGAIEKAVDEYMGQLRACKIGLEKRIGITLEPNWPVMELISEHATVLLNRFQLGTDGKSAYRRLMGKESGKKILEFGEQVLAKPKRQLRSNRKQSLKSRWRMGTWVGIAPRSNEHLVVLPGGGPIIKVRTVKRRPIDEKWNSEAIKEIVATTRHPNPRDLDQSKVLAEGQTKGLTAEIDISRSVEVQIAGDVNEPPIPTRQRDFRITRKVIEKFGYSPGCIGCEAHMTGGCQREHSMTCRRRLEDEMVKDDSARVTITKRDLRMNAPDGSVNGEQDTSVDAEIKVGVNPQEGKSQNAQTHKEKEENVSQQIPGKVSKNSSNTASSSKDKSPCAAEGRRRERAADDDADITKDARAEAAKRRRLNSLQSEKQVLGNIGRQIGECTERFRVREMLAALESGSGHEKVELKTCEKSLKSYLRSCMKTDVTTIMEGMVKQELPTPHSEDEQRLRDLYSGVEFYDDVSGEYLDKDLVMKARQLEMAYFKKMRVYDKVDRSEAKANGAKVITVRWLDINKGDKMSPNYRSRLVAREIKRDKRLDLFAPTPPLESMKLLMSICARGQHRARPLRLATIDIKRAYFYAPSRRPFYVEIPPEDKEAGDEAKVGKLRVSLYGTKDAAQNWTEAYTKFLVSLGFRRGKASPCNFLHAKREIRLTVHGDDFLVIAPHTEIRWLQMQMDKQYENKIEILGPETGLMELRILNRTIRWTAEGLEYEGDQRHADIIIEELGLQNSKPLQTPCVANSAVKAAVESEVCKKDAGDGSFRSISARLNYMAMDRSDLQYASKSISRHMSNPNEEGWCRLKRAGRYLVGAKRLVQLFRWALPSKELKAYADSDWAGEEGTSKSTSGGMVCYGDHVLKSWSTTQQVIAMSSGEAELYAMTKASAQLIGLCSMARDFDLELDGIVHSDSTAAIGIVHRMGLGKTRHIRVQYLWIQERVYDGDLKVRKISTDVNPADLMTKPLTVEVMRKHLKKMQMEFRAGRADSALKLHALGNNADEWLRNLEVSVRANEGTHENSRIVHNNACSSELCAYLDGNILNQFMSEYACGRCSLIRKHNKVREALFTPMKVAKGPVSADKVGTYRYTVVPRYDCEGKFILSVRVFIDNWKEASFPHKRVHPYMGWTLFSDSGVGYFSDWMLSTSVREGVTELTPSSSCRDGSS